MVHSLIELRWRKALEARGKDWVITELRKRPGQPDDPVYEVVFEEPLPTREFCQRWFVEQDNKVLHLSGHTKAVLIASILLAVFAMLAAENWVTKLETPKYVRGGGSSNGGGGSLTNNIPGLSNDIPGQLSPAIPGAATPANTGSSMSPTGLCTYATYETAACKAKQ